MNTQTIKQCATSINPVINPVRNLLLALAAVAVMSACSPSADEDSAKNQVIAEQARKDLLAEQAAEKARQDEAKAQQDTAVSQAVAAERRAAAASRSRGDSQQPARSSSTRSICSNCGVVLAVNEVKTAGKSTPLGVIAGGVVGGLLGNQVGKGTGRDVATVAGAVGGAYAGSQIEKNVRKTTNYEVVVKMENGEELTVLQATNPNVVKGDSIRIENEAVVRR